MNMMDEVLKKYNLKWEDLNVEEKSTLSQWMQNLQQGTLTVEKVREYIHAMRDAVENELTRFDLGSKQDILLKARLRNYMLLEAFLATPEKAKAQIERTLAQMGK